MNNNQTKNLGKSLMTAEGNYFVTKEGFFFYMTPQGKHLDKYEKEHQKLHNSPYWANMKKMIGEPQPLTEDLSKKAALIIKMKLKPLAEKIRLRKAKEARADENNAKIRPTTERSFSELRSILEKGKLKVA